MQQEDILNKCSHMMSVYSSIGFKSWLAGRPDHMQMFDAGLTN